MVIDNGETVDIGNDELLIEGSITKDFLLIVETNFEAKHCLGHGILCGKTHQTRGGTIREGEKCLHNKIKFRIT